MTRDLESNLLRIYTPVEDTLSLSQVSRVVYVDSWKVTTSVGEWFDNLPFLDNIGSEWNFVNHWSLYIGPGLWGAILLWTHHSLEKRCNPHIKAPKMIQAPSKYYTKQLWDEAFFMDFLFVDFLNLIAFVPWTSWWKFCCSHPPIFLHLIFKLHHPAREPPSPNKKNNPSEHVPHFSPSDSQLDRPFFLLEKVNQFDGLCQHHFADSWSCTMFGVSWLQFYIWSLIKFWGSLVKKNEVRIAT